MALRTGHGAGAGVPRVEVLPADELPVGVAAPEPRPEAMRRPPYAAGSAEAQEAGRRGGKRKAGATALASRLGLSNIVADPSFAPYKGAAESFRRAQVTRLASTVGGGECGPAPSSIVASAALQLAASRWAFDRSMHELGSKLANDSRQNLLAAHELASREAQSRPRPMSRTAAVIAELTGGKK